MNFQRTVIFISLVFLLLSCESPTSEVTKPPEDDQQGIPTGETPAVSLNTPTETSTPIPVPPTSTVVDFLVDKSTSVDNEVCDKDQKRYEFVNFMVKDVLALWASPTNDGALYIGASQFGKDVLPTYNFSNIQEISNFDLRRDVLGTDDTKIATGIQDEVARMGVVEAKKRILVVLTDGQFASESIQEVDKALKNSVEDNLSIYFVLVCPKAIDPAIRDNWYNQFDGKLLGVQVFDSLEEAGIKILKDLQEYNFFPSDFAAVFIPYKDDIEIPGDAKSVGFSYWSMSGQDLSINMNGTPFATVFSDTPEPKKDINPKPDCSMTQFQIPSVSSAEAGMLFVTYKTYENIKLAVEFDSQEPEILNNQPVKIKTVATGLDDSDRFGSWRYCYDIQVVTPLGGALISQACADNSYECLDDGHSAFRTDWLWTPPMFNAPQTVAFQAHLVNPQFEIRFADSQPVTAYVNFQPANSIPGSLQYETSKDFPDNPLLKVVIGTIPFEYVVADPKIYLTSSKNQKELNEISSKLRSVNSEITWLACPYIDSGSLGTSVMELTKYEDLKQFSLEEVYARIFPESKFNTPLAPIYYKLETFHYIISECDYSQIKLEWEDQAGIKKIAWVCKIEDDSIFCNRDSNTQ